MLLTRTKNVREIVGHENISNTQKGDYCAHFVALIKKITPLFGIHWSGREELFYLSPIDSSLCTIWASMKRRNEGIEEALAQLLKNGCWKIQSL